MDVVYAMASGHVGGPHGLMTLVRKGTHWPATDPLVRANPEMFSTDPRWGLCCTVPVSDADLDAAAEPIPAGRRQRAGAAS